MGGFRVSVGEVGIPEYHVQGGPTGEAMHFLIVNATIYPTRYGEMPQGMRMDPTLPGNPGGF